MPVNLIARFKALKFWQKVALYICLGLMLYSILGFLILPTAARMVAVNQLRDYLQRDVHIGAVRMNPYTLSATIRELAILEPDGDNLLAAFHELYVNLQAVSLFKWAPVFKEVRLDGLYAAPVLHKDRRWNFADLLPAPTPATPPTTEEAPPGEPFRFSLNNIQIRGSEIHFQDDIRGKTHHITDIDMALPFLSNLPAQIDIFVHPHFNATVNGTPFKLQGQVKPFADSRETEMLLDLQGIDLAAYMPYVPPDAGVKILSGLLDVKLSLIYMSHQDGTQALNAAGTLALKTLAMTDGADRPLLNLDRLAIDISALAPMDGIISIGEIRLERPAFTLTRLPTEKVVRTRDALAPRDAFRQINLPPPVFKIARVILEDVQLTVHDLKSPADSGPEGEKQTHTMLRIPRFTVDRTRVDIDRQSVRIGEVAGRDGRFEIRRLGDGQLNLDVFLGPSETGEETTPASAAEPWQIDVQKVQLAGYAIHGVNLIPEDPVTVMLDQIDLDVSDFSTKPQAETRMALNGRINESGRLTSRTTMTLTPLKADVQLNLERIDLSAFYPFIKPYLGVVLADGDLSVGGDLTLQGREDGPPAIVYKGQAAITDFRTLDRRKARPFVTWQALNLEGMDIGVNPTYLTIGDIRVDQPFSHLLIDEEGRLNLAMATILTPEEEDRAPAVETEEAAPAAEPQADAPPVPINIGALQGRGGKIVFTDRSFKPGFQAVIESVETRITGLATEATAPAKVDIKGRVQGHAPAAISGEIDPLAENMYADLVFDFQQMDLTAASPYAGRYVGRTISQGKLSVKTTYHIENRALKADHDLFFDQFDFGARVDSPDDLNLPVDLAVALLKDRRGEIHIDLPVSGDMDDPDFTVGGIVLKAFVNLVVKAATSPFALLGSMFESENLDQLEFEPGRSRLTSATTEKLDALRKVLYERPALRLEISGYADPASDTPAYADLLFQRKLRAQKGLRLAEDGQAAAPRDDIVIAPEEYEEYLQAAYEAETFAKPKNFIGMEKTLPPAEAEALIRQHIEVERAALEELAYDRALAVKNYLLDAEQVEAERVFLVKPTDALAPAALEGMAPGRVALGLK